MKFLIIGGTRFQGQFLVNELLDSGHAVTVFHRGTNKISPRIGLTDMLGNRDTPSDLARLTGLQFDACIDTCAYVPNQISLLSSVLSTKNYCLISSVYVYFDQDKLLHEKAPVVHHPQSRTILNEENYGALKALCEQEALIRFGSKSLILRPSVIIGVGDHTERLQFWVRLIGSHGRRLNILGKVSPIQPVDVRDLVNFTVRCIENKRSGPVNVCGEPISLSSLFDGITTVAQKDCEERAIYLEDLSDLGLNKLPYCTDARLARYDTQLSESWGYTRRNLQNSITEIFDHAKKQGFKPTGFQNEEEAVLRLFF